MSSIYWDINQILRYQRNFNLINGERSIGKSYTTQKFMLDRALHRGQEFVYLVRTQDEKKKGIFGSSFEKVIANEFEGYEIDTTTETMHLIQRGTGENGDDEKVILGYCLALTEAVKIKKRSFPNVKYLMFDEYMLESNQSIGYVNGWNEPDLFLNIYHTIDRENDKVICFLLGNNTSFYNPYHMHPAFNIPHIDQGEIWKNENVLFQWATGSQALKTKKAGSKFLKMIESTNYGSYALQGNYIDDSTDFILERSHTSSYMFAFAFDDHSFGVWIDKEIGLVFISDKYDPSNKMHFALTLKDHRENTLLTKDKNNTLLQWLSKNFKLGNVRFENMEIKKRSEDAIRLIL